MRLTRLEAQDLTVLAEARGMGNFVRSVRRSGMPDTSALPVLSEGDLHSVWQSIPSGCKLLLQDAVSLLVLQVAAAGLGYRLPPRLRDIGLILISGEDVSRPAVTRLPTADEVAAWMDDDEPVVGEGVG